MTDFYQKYGPATGLTIALNSLADGAGVDGAMVDNAVERYFDADVALVLKGSAAGNTGLCEVYLLRSLGGVDFSDSANAELIGTVRMSGVNVVKKTLRIRELPRWWKLRLVNMSGAALAASGQGAEMQGIRYSDA